MRTAGLLVAAAVALRLVGGAVLLLVVGGPRWAAVLWLMLNIRVRLFTERARKQPLRPEAQRQVRR